MTEYTYGAGNRLTKVEMIDGAYRQQRTFSYDGRGLLTSEQHPESGTTTYRYDARGNVIEREDAVATVTTSYDDAGRVVNVSDDAGTLKGFTYDRANAGNDYSMGKLSTASRVNRGTPSGDFTVTETYTYAGKGGLLSKRSTALSTGQTFAEEYTYDTMGNIIQRVYPKCTGCTGPTLPARTIAPAFGHGVVNAINPYTHTAPTKPAIEYHPNGAVASITHANAAGGAGPLYEQLIANGLPRPSEIKVTNFCDSSNFRIDQQPQPRTINSGQQANLSVSTTGATTYQWYKVVGTTSSLLAGQTGSTLTDTPATSTTYWVRVGNGSCTIDSDRALVTVNTCVAPNTTITAPSTMTASATATASVTATAGATYDWTVTVERSCPVRGRARSHSARDAREPCR